MIGIGTIESAVPILQEYQGRTKNRIKTPSQCIIRPDRSSVKTLHNSMRKFKGSQDTQHPPNAPSRDHNRHALPKRIQDLRQIKPGTREHSIKQLLLQNLLTAIPWQLK